MGWGGLDESPDNTILIFKAGTDNTFSASKLIINCPLRLKGKDATIARSRKSLQVLK
jgi:hypothetical protein